LSMLETRSEIFASTDKSSRDYFFYHTTLQLGIRTAQLNLGWINEAIEKIDVKSLYLYREGLGYIITDAFVFLKQDEQHI
ncbi:MAG: hypothetical protein N3B13_10610, partial [Deltaproteobacteria bacterium]|nr:hypothetical protein [Deltaproteobacteria bacterium]